jgi:hypothetical protein
MRFGNASARNTAPPRVRLTTGLLPQPRSVATDSGVVNGESVRRPMSAGNVHGRPSSNSWEARKRSTCCRRAPSNNNSRGTSSNSWEARRRSTRCRRALPNNNSRGTSSNSWEARRLWREQWLCRSAQLTSRACCLEFRARGVRILRIRPCRQVICRPCPLRRQTLS